MVKGEKCFNPPSMLKKGGGEMLLMYYVIWWNGGMNVKFLPKVLWSVMAGDANVANSAVTCPRN